MHASIAAPVAALVKALCLLAMIHFTTAVVVQINTGTDVEYYLSLFALLAAVGFATGDWFLHRLPRT